MGLRAFLLGALLAICSAGKMGEKICILPVGDVHPEVLKQLQQSLAEAFFCPVILKPPAQEDLGYAYDAGRNQYLSPAILERISVHKEGAAHLLGIVDVDLFVPELNFVFGEADIAGGVCLISLTRLREEYYGRKPDMRLYLQRVVKEAIHELGHTYGLRHCRDSQCVMFFSNSLRDTDRKEAKFCRRCVQLLK